jgi:hypothetical protein
MRRVIHALRPNPHEVQSLNYKEPPMLHDCGTWLETKHHHLDQLLDPESVLFETMMTMTFLLCFKLRRSEQLGVLEVNLEVEPCIPARGNVVLVEFIC